MAPDADEWSLTSTRAFIDERKEAAMDPRADSGEGKMIQALTDQAFTKVCVDSGAGESVCPIDAFPSYGTHKTAKTGVRYTAAGGQELINVGEQRPNFKCGGVDAWMAFQ